MDAETVLHEGPTRVIGNGWGELPTGRLPSPEAVHHIDVSSRAPLAPELPHSRAVSGW